MQVALTPVEPSDKPFLEELFREARAPDFLALPLPQASLDQLLDLQFRAQTQGYATQFPSAEDSIITVDGERVGRLLVARSPSEIHVVDIALLSRYRGKGIGGGLLQTLCDEARAANKTFSLSVRAGNPAERLYRRLGLMATGSDGMQVTMKLMA